jgi:alcohol dehydrogenase class IV
MGGNVLSGVTVESGLLALVVRDCLKDPVISNTPRMPSFAQVEEIVQDAVLQRAPYSA